MATKKKTKKVRVETIYCVYREYADGDDYVKHCYSSRADAKKASSYSQNEFVRPQRLSRRIAR